MSRPWALWSGLVCGSAAASFFANSEQVAVKNNPPSWGKLQTAQTATQCSMAEVSITEKRRWPNDDLASSCISAARESIVWKSTGVSGTDGSGENPRRVHSYEVEARDVRVRALRAERVALQQEVGRRDFALFIRDECRMWPDNRTNQIPNGPQGQGGRG